MITASRPTGKRVPDAVLSARPKDALLFPRRIYNRSANLFAFVAVLLAFLPPCPAAAQEDSPGTTISYLSRALPLVNWDANRSGGLLALEWSREGAIRLNAGSSGERLTLRAVAERFGRRVTPVGTLTALTPPTMVVLETNPQANPANRFPRQERLPFLLASLTPAQWRLIGSERGLGISDLAPDQTNLFAALLPDPMRLQPTIDPESPPAVENIPESVTLPGPTRAAVRLRLVRTTTLTAQMENQPGRALLDMSKKTTEGGPLMLAADGADFRDPTTAAMRREEPNRLKPGDLDFADPRLNPVIALEGAATVDDLVKRAAKAAGLELYADPRMGRSFVYVRGRARAGDALKALCLCVTGTFRAVGPAWVLTDDREGLRARRNRIDDVSLEDTAAKGAHQLDLIKKIAEQKPWQYLRYAAADPLALPNDVLQRIEEARSKGEYSGLQIPVRDLPPAVGEAARKAMAAYDEPLLYDRVWVDASADILLLLPDGRVARDFLLRADYLLRFPFEMPVPPAQPPGALPFADMKRHVALLSPRDADEAVLAVDQVRRLGWTEVWVRQEIGAPTAALEAAVAAGRDRGIPVYAVVRVLRPAVGETLADDAADIGPDGETAARYYRRRQKTGIAAVFASPVPDDTRDWLRVDRPEALAPRWDDLKKLAALPGLSGLVLRDTAAPGYADPGDTGTQSFALPGGWDGGYLEGWRLEFLRRESVDPVDLLSLSPSFGGDLSLPFFNDPPIPNAPPPAPGQTLPEQALGPLQRWNRMRYRAGMAVMKDLHAVLRAAAPDLPLIAASRGDVSIGLNYYALWDRPEAMPNSFLQVQMAGLSALQGRSSLIGVAPGTLRTGMVAPSSEVESLKMMSGSLGSFLRQEASPVEGVVVDLADRPLGEALALLRGL